MASIRGTVDINTRSSLAAVRELRHEWDLLANSPAATQRRAELAAQATARAQQQAAQRAFQAQRDGYRATVQAALQAQRAQTQAALQTSRAQQQAARDAQKAIVQAQRDADRARTQSARDAQRAADRAARDAARFAQQNSRDQARAAQRAADQAIRDAQRSAREQAAASRRATNDIVRDWDRQLRAALRQRAEERRLRDQRIAEGRAAAGQLANGASRTATAGGVALLGGLLFATREAVNFEQAFTGVTKTVKASDAQFEELGKSIRQMAKDIPVGTTELSTIAQSAGQLGIHFENIKSFTRVIADLGVSTNLASEQGATELARFANITRTSQKEFSNLGSALVDLGNNFATTESEITDMSLRLASAGSLAGLKAPDILAFATALSSLGINAEAGGTAMSKSFKIFEQAVRGGGQELKIFAQVSGVTQAQFQKQFKTDAAGAILSFVTGLNKIKKAGGDVNGVLNAVGMKNAYISNAMRVLASNPELLARALDKSSTAWRDNTALTIEATKRYGTTASRLKMAENELRDFGITVGTTVVPALNTLLGMVKPTLDRFNDLDRATQDNYVRSAAYAGITLIVIGRLKALGDTIVLVRTAYVGLQAMNAGAIAGGTLWGSVLTGLGAVSLPLVAAAIGAVVVAGGLWAINQQKNIENGAKLRAANADVADSARDVERSFDSLSKVAAINPDAIAIAAKLRAEYDKLKDSAQNLKKFSLVDLSKARQEISLNTKLKPLEKRVLIDEINRLQGEIDGQIEKLNYKATVKAEADKGSLANLKDAFADTYGDLYRMNKRLYVDPVLNSNLWLWGQISYAGRVTWEGLKKGMADFGIGWTKGWGDLWDSIAGKADSAVNLIVGGASDKVAQMWNNMLGGLKDAWIQFEMWFQGRSADGGVETAGFDAKGIADQKRRNREWRRTHASPLAPQRALGPTPDRNYDVRSDGTNPSVLLNTPERRRAAALAARSSGAVTGGTTAPNVDLPAPKHKKTEAEKAAEREAREALRREKDQLADTAKAWDSKAKAAEKSAKATVEAAKTEIEALTGLRDTWRGVFGDLQSQFVAMGDLNNPLGPLINDFQKLLDLGGQSSKIIEGARSKVQGFARNAKEARGQAAGARSRQEVLSGLDGVVPGGSSNTANSIAAASDRLQKFRENYKRECDRLADTTVNAATRMFSGIMGPRKGDTAAQTMARFKNAGIGFAPGADTQYLPGDIVYSGATRKNSAGHVQVIGSNGNFQDQYGSHARPTTRPQWVVRVGSGGSRRGGSGGSGVSLLDGEGGEGAFEFDLKKIDGTLSKIGKVDKAWGAAVKNTEGNSARFAIQTQLANKEFQEALEASAARTGKTVPQIIKWLREFANYADLRLNKDRAVEKSAESIKEQIANVKEARAALASLNQESAAELALIKEKRAYLEAHPGDEVGFEAIQARRDYIKGLKDNDALKKLRGAGRGVEADVAEINLIAAYDAKALQQVLDQRQEAAKEIAAQIAERDAQWGRDAVEDYLRRRKEARDVLDGMAQREQERMEEHGRASVDAFKSLKAALKDTEGTAESLRQVLAAIPDDLRQLPGIIELVNRANAAIASRGSRERIAPALDAAKEQQISLSRDILNARLGAKRPLTELQQQELEWKWADYADRQNKDPITPEETAKIEQQRNAVRGLLTEWETLQKSMRAVDRITDAFDTAYDSILSRQKTFLGALQDGLLSALNSMARDVLTSQLRSGLMSLFGVALGGAAGASGGSGLKFSAEHGNIGPTKLDGSFAVGINRIKKTGIYKLHPNEAVLPSQEAEEYRRRKSAELAAVTPTSTSSRAGNVTIVYQHNGDILTDSPADWQERLQSSSRSGRSSNLSRSEEDRLIAARAGKGRRFF